jgi:hypothetical protein
MGAASRGLPLTCAHNPQNKTPVAASGGNPFLCIQTLCLLVAYGAHLVLGITPGVVRSARLRRVVHPPLVSVDHEKAPGESMPGVCIRVAQL